MSKLCKNCALCCDYVTIKIPTGIDKNDIDEIRWYLLHNIIVFTEFNKEWYVKIHSKCNALNEKGLCSIYSTRPNVCSDYSLDACERYKGKDYVEETDIFTTEKEFLEFVEKNLKLKKIKN